MKSVPIVSYLLLFTGMVLTFIPILMLTMVSEVENVFQPVIILPISYVIGFWFAAFLFSRKAYLVKSLIMFLYGIKMVILPLLIYISGRFDMSGIRYSLQNSVSDAVWIQVIEYAAVMITILCIPWPDGKLFKNIDLKKDRAISRREWNLLIFCVIIVACAIVIYPELLNKYRPVYFADESNFIEWKKNSTIAVNSISPYIYYPLNWLLTVTRLCTVYMLVIFFARKMASRHPICGICLSFIMIFFALVYIVPDDVAVSILTAVILFALLIKLYPGYSSMLKKICVVIISLLFLYIFILYPILNSNYNLAEYLSRRLNAYFGGVMNLAGALNMSATDKFTYFVGDFLRSIPVINGFFTDMSTTTELFNIVFGYDPVYYSQIVPMAGQGYFYLSYLGAALFPAVTCLMGAKFYKKLINSISSFDFFVYGLYFLILIIGLAMYNFFLIFYLLISYCPLLIIHSVQDRKLAKKIVGDEVNESTDLSEGKPIEPTRRTSCNWILYSSRGKSKG